MCLQCMVPGAAGKHGLPAHSPVVEAPAAESGSVTRHGPRAVAATVLVLIVKLTTVTRMTVPVCTFYLNYVAIIHNYIAVGLKPQHYL